MSALEINYSFSPLYKNLYDYDHEFKVTFLFKENMWKFLPGVSKPES
jgi:hypothetical protein